MRFCGRCGAPVTGAFCGGCGAPIAPEDRQAPIDVDETLIRPFQVPAASEWPPRPSFVPPPTNPGYGAAYQPSSWQAGPGGMGPDPIRPQPPFQVPPPSAPPPGRAGWIVLALASAVVVAGLAGTAVWAVSTGFLERVVAGVLPAVGTASATQPARSQAPSPQAPSPARTATPASTGPTSAPATIPPVDAVADLSAQRQQDLTRLRLNGSWGVQLASKYDGVVDDSLVAQNGSHTFYAADILAEHRALRSDPRVAGPVYLVLATDFGKQRAWTHTIWVTIAAPGWTSQGDADAWCRARHPGLSDKERNNVCMPRQLIPPQG